MLNRLRQIAHLLAQAETADDVLAALDGVVAQAGVRPFSVWTPYAAIPATRAAAVKTMTYRAPIEAQEALKQGFLRHGPSVMTRHAATSPAPFTFGEAQRRLRPTGDDRWIFNAYRDHDVKDGLYCSHGPWILVYASDHSLNGELSDETRMALDAAGQMAMQRVKEIAGRGKPQGHVDLSPRERAVLSHLSDGLHVGAIAVVPTCGCDTHFWPCKQMVITGWHLPPKVRSNM